MNPALQSGVVRQMLSEVVRSPLGLLSGVLIHALLSSLGAQEAAAHDARPPHGFAFEKDRDAQDFASPDDSYSFVSGSVVPGHPGLSGAVGRSTGIGSHCFTEPNGASESVRRALLIEGLILSKYLHFRESLDTP